MIFLQNHYQIMEKIFSPQAIKKILIEQNYQIIISTLLKKNSEQCFLKIMMHGKFWQEEAMNIYLSDNNLKLLVSLTFKI